MLNMQASQTKSTETSGCLFRAPNCNYIWTLQYNEMANGQSARLALNKL